MNTAFMILTFLILLSSPVVLNNSISKTKCTMDIEIIVVHMTLIATETVLSLLESNIRARKNLVNQAARQAKRVIVADTSIMNLLIMNIQSWMTNTTEKMITSV